MMAIIWYVIVSVMLAMYVVLDGFDLGAGALHRVLARTESQRRTLFAATGPLWDGNEVWLIAAGGALFCAFPGAYAAGFSGFYLPLIFVLWLLIGRGLSTELRNHHPDPLWRAFCDTVLVVSCGLAIVVLGAAIGNVIRGVPLDASGSFHLPLFSSTEVAVLDRYTVATGVVALVVLVHHGARFVAWKVKDELHARARKVARVLLWVLVPALLAITAATVLEQPSLVRALSARAWAWPLLALVPLSLAALLWLDRTSQDLAAFLASGTMIVALLAATAAASFPLLLRSTLGHAYDLNAYNASASTHGLRTALGWWCVGMPLVVVYFVVLFRATRGKVE